MIKSVYLKDRDLENINKLLKRAEKISTSINYSESKIIRYALHLATYNFENMKDKDLKESIEEFFKHKDSIDTIVDTMFKV